MNETTGDHCFQTPQTSKQENKSKREREPAATPSPSLYIHTSITNGKGVAHPEVLIARSPNVTGKKVPSAQATEAAGFFFLRT